MNKFYKWTSRGVFYLFGIMCLFGSIKEIMDGYQEDNLPIARIIISLIMFSIAAWTIYGLIYINKPTVINGRNKETNKQIVFELVHQLFPDMEFFFNEDTLTGTRDWTTKQTGKEMIVKFKDSDIFVNLMTKVRFGDIDSPFHVFTNQADIKEMKSQFLSRI